MGSPFDVDVITWARLRQLLGQALLMDATQRARWIEALPAEDAVLAPRLRALLQHAPATDIRDHASAAAAAHWLQTLPRIETGQFADRPPVARPAEQVGPYRLVRELGHGGMASVWLAERTDVLQGRQVAVKLPLGAWHGAGLAERLARERTILATLSHPHIATLYDAGVDGTGRPWLALEYVQGERIDEHCARGQLDTSARLRLMLQVIGGVAHAHSRLVVHRDLKPANILVSSDGHVKLLDFGIAKLLDEDLVADATELTRQAGRALTPDYAAPEQLAGQPLGTACDIYTLGVLLYELLAGERPYRLPTDSRAAMERALAELQLVPPSQRSADAATSSTLRGDLDTIVLKALKKLPAERYATADALAEDIERYLRHEPVLARPDSRWYRTQRFVSRHRVAVGAATAVFVAVLGGAGMAAWQARVARAEAHRAEEVKAFIASVFEDADPWRARRGKLQASELLRSASKRVNARFTHEPSIRVELLNVIGTSLAGLEEFDAAEAVLREALAVGEAALPASHGLRVTSRHHLSRLYVSSQDSDKLKVELASLIPMLREREQEFGPELVEALVAQVQVDNDEGRYADMEVTARGAVAVAERALAADAPMRIVARRALANALENQAKFVEARRESTAAFELSSRIFSADPRHPVHSDTRFVHARILSESGDHEAALPLMRQSIEVTEAMLGSDSITTATLVREMVSPLMETHRLHEGLAASERALAILRRHHGEGTVHVAYALVAHGTIMRELRHGDVGRTEFEAAVRTLALELGADHGYTLDVRANAALGRALSGDAPGAAVELDAVAQRFEATGKPVLDKVVVYRALAHRLSGRPQAAAEILRPALATMQAPRELARARLEMAEIHLALGQPAQALELLRLLPPRDVTSRPGQAEADLAFGRALLGVGQAAQAVPYLQRADSFWRGFDPAHRGAKEAGAWLSRGLQQAG